MAGKELLPGFYSEVGTSTASEKHRELAKKFGRYAIENFGGEMKAIHAEHQVGDLLADVCIEGADGKEVVEVDTGIEKYVRLKILTNGTADYGHKLGQLEHDKLVNWGEPVREAKDGFYFVPRGNMRDVGKELSSRGWRVEPPYRMNRLVEKFYRMGRGADRFSILVHKKNKEIMDTFLGELEGRGPPVYRVYVYSEFASNVTGFVELGGGNKTCQK